MSKRYSNNNGPLNRVWNYKIKEALGIDPKKHWPKHGARGLVEGVEVVVTRKGYTIKDGCNIVPATSRMARRTFAECPNCRKYVCAGHLGQHMASQVCQ